MGDSKLIQEKEAEKPSEPSEILPKIAFAIVVFRETYYETFAFKTLIEAILNVNEAKVYCIYIYDNTDFVDWKVPKPKNSISNLNIRYFHNPKNPGISVAYNAMASSAIEDGMNWIVFMDQDTRLPKDALSYYNSSARHRPEILVKAPSIEVDGKQFSPSGFRMMKAYPLKKPLTSGIHPLNKLTIINSCLMVNLSFFTGINGYNERLRLDFTDTEFIERVKRKCSHFELLPFRCGHGFSNNISDLKSSIFRFSIYKRDLINYPVESFIQRLQLLVVGVLHTLQLTYRYKSTKFIVEIFK